MSKIFKNRKGEDMMVDFITILVFAVILIVFLVIFFLTKNQTGQDTLNDFKDKDAAFMLDSFLRAPYLKDDSKSMAEIISEDAFNDDFKRSEDSFHYFFRGIDNYMVYDTVSLHLCIEKSGSKLASFESIGKVGSTISTWLPSCNDYSNGETKGAISSSTIIPGRDNTPLKITLVIWFDEDPKRTEWIQ